MGTSERRLLWVMAAPFVVGVAVLVLAPALGTFSIAAFDWDLLGPPRFVGLGNFRELLDDPVFRISLRNSLLFLAAAVPLRLLGAVVLALALRGRTRGQAVGRVAVVLPTVVPDAAYALLWLWLLDPLFGPVNLALSALGLPAPAWFARAGPARWAVILMSVWQLGEGFLIALVARRQVPRELLELAAINGAGRWGRLARVSLPIMAPALALIAIRDSVMALQATFVPALLVTEGGPPPAATMYLPSFAYRNAFDYLRYGYASAALVLMVAVTLSLVWLQFRLAARLSSWRWPAPARG
jgi:multiple sugar transport system permease protein